MLNFLFFDTILIYSMLQKETFKMNVLFRILSLLWMGVIFYFSSLNQTDLKQLPAVSDIFAHGTVYGLLGMLLYFSFKHRRRFKAVLISCLYGISDEIHQSFIPGRTPEVKDLIVDTVAAFLAVTLIGIISSQVSGKFTGGNG